MNERAQAVDALEHRLGRAFKNRELLERALTHASVGGGVRRVRDNEVLEFVGDRVIGLLAAERLSELYPKGPEGELSVRLHRLVNREACARVARRMGLSAALRLSAGESKTGGRENDTILGDACEAVMAAVHVDGGLEAARQVFLDLWSEELAETTVGSSRDPKTTLQEWAQGHGRPLPVYTVTRRSGPDHAPVFTVEVAVDGLPAATADGRSRKEAEKAAAAALLEREAGA